MEMGLSNWGRLDQHMEWYKSIEQNLAAIHKIVDHQFESSSYIFDLKFISYYFSYCYSYIFITEFAKNNICI